MNYYPHHISDFNNATRHLSRVERSIYRDMLDLYYDTEKPLPIDMVVLRRKLIARTEEESTAVEQVLNEFFQKTDAGWFHGRCEEVIFEYQENISAKSAAGKASAAKRAEREAKRLAELNGCSTGDEQVLNGSGTGVQLTKTKTKTKKETPPLPPAGGKSRPQGFKAWGKEEFTASVKESNHDGLLLESEVSEFIAYWTEPNSRGKPRFSLEKTWDTRRRMHTALQVVYEKRRNQAPSVGQRVVSGAEQTRKYLQDLYAD